MEDGGSHGRSQVLHWSFRRRREGEDKAVRASGLRVWCCVRVCVGSCGVREISGVRLFFFFSFLFSFGNYFLFLHKQFMLKLLCTFKG